jgi:hypothetical protein
MLLLISYFNMVDQEALHVWELAEYDSDLNDHLDFTRADDTNVPDLQGLIPKTILMVLSPDVRTMYSDGFELAWNEAGLTFDFTQVSGKGQRISVARVGMSYEQAEKVAECLANALLQIRYNGSKKLLPPATDKND